MNYKKFILLPFIAIVFLFIACNPNDPDCDINVIQNTYTGDIFLDPDKEDPSADFTGTTDSGVYTFEWCNPQSRASLDFDITTASGGSVRFIVSDDEAKVVLDKTRPGSGEDSFSGVTDNGKSGTWTVEITFVDVNGDGSWSMHPGT